MPRSPETMSLSRPAPVRSDVDAELISSHAAAAQQVSASTEEQSAACEEMSSASTSMLTGAGRLKEIVSALRTTR